MANTKKNTKTKAAAENAENVAEVTTATKAEAATETEAENKVITAYELSALIRDKTPEEREEIFAGLIVDRYVPFLTKLSLIERTIAMTTSNLGSGERIKQTHMRYQLDNILMSLYTNINMQPQLEGIDAQTVVADSYDILTVCGFFKYFAGCRPEDSIRFEEMFCMDCYDYNEQSKNVAAIASNFITELTEAAKSYIGELSVPENDETVDSEE